MKKLTILIAVAAVVCFSVPAMAVDWNFYGSARMATCYTSDNPKDIGDKNTDLRWDFQGNSRLGANVKADHIKGQFELATKAANGGPGGDGRSIPGASMAPGTSAPAASKSVKTTHRFRSLSPVSRLTKMPV